MDTRASSSAEGGVAVAEEKRYTGMRYMGERMKSEKALWLPVEGWKRRMTKREERRIFITLPCEDSFPLARQKRR